MARKLKSGASISPSSWLNTSKILRDIALHAKDTGKPKLHDRIDQLEKLLKKEK